MQIFFDTEFTGLTDDAALISVGMVDERGAEFYAELSDTYTAADCSDFCVRHVLPLLDGGSAQRTLTGLRAELTAWLEQRRDAMLICDSRRDVKQLQTLFPHGLPVGVEVRVLGWWQNLKRRLLNGGRRVHRRYGLRVHHALDDARVNRLVLLR